jgi:hypothetical protein
MTGDPVYSTQVSRHVNAPRYAICRALLDADAIARRRVRADMTSQVSPVRSCEGGAFRVSLIRRARQSRQIGVTN